MAWRLSLLTRAHPYPSCNNKCVTRTCERHFGSMLTSFCKVSVMRWRAFQLEQFQLWNTKVLHLIERIEIGGGVWKSNPPFDPRRAESPALKAGKVTGPHSP